MPIVGYWPGSVALGIILIFYFAVVSQLTYFHFLVTTASSITNGEARRMDVCAWPILSCSLCCANTIGAAIRTPLIGEAQRI